LWLDKTKFHIHCFFHLFLQSISKLLITFIGYYGKNIEIIIPDSQSCLIYWKPKSSSYLLSLSESIYRFYQCTYLKYIRIIPSFFQCTMRKYKSQWSIEAQKFFFFFHNKLKGISIISITSFSAVFDFSFLIHRKIPIMDFIDIHLQQRFPCI